MTQPGLYIHVPFCKKKCAYCNFYSVTTLCDVPEYIKAILEEMSLYARDFNVFDTVYIGGGTPSLLTAADLAAILMHARNTFTIAPDAEITLEVNPADVNSHDLTSLRQAGVNRLNLGIQSFDDSILRFLERRHSCGQALESIEQSRAAGFDNIGLDLIYGIPNQSLLSWKNTLSLALSFDPEHLSCYQLSLEDDTPLGRRHQEHEFALPDEDAQVDFFMTTADILENACYHHYEVSNFARADRFKSRHNQKYWRHVPYLGIGPAAHSFSGQRRWWNHRSIKKYIFDIREGRRPVEGSEHLTLPQKRLETCFLGLRTPEGISMQHLINMKLHFGEHEASIDKHESSIDKQEASLSEQQNTPRLEKWKILDELVRQGFIVIQDGFLKPTRTGLAVADRLALML